MCTKTSLDMLPTHINLSSTNSELCVMLNTVYHPHASTTPVLFNTARPDNKLLSQHATKKRRQLLVHMMYAMNLML